MWTLAAPNLPWCGTQLAETEIASQVATDTWYTVRLGVELALLDDKPLVGGIADIRKAFNRLPREPLLQMAGLIGGVASQILLPWERTLCNLERHFVIRQAYGPGLTAVTGFAEGCC